MSISWFANYPTPKGLNTNQSANTKITRMKVNIVSEVHLNRVVFVPRWKVTSSSALSDWGALVLLTNIKIAAQKRNRNKAKCKKLMPKKILRKLPSETDMLWLLAMNSNARRRMPIPKPTHKVTIAPLAFIHEKYRPSKNTAAIGGEMYACILCK